MSSIIIIFFVEDYNVEDVAQALISIGKYGVQGKIYGIGSGVYKPLRWYIETIRDIISHIISSEGRK